jgi:hypothetical protein
MLHTETMLRSVLKAENPHESDSFVMNAQVCPQQSHAHPHKAMPTCTSTPLPISTPLTDCPRLPVPTLACMCRPTHARPCPPMPAHAR